MPNSKKKRTPKTSKGTNSGARKAPQTTLALALMGKGLCHPSKSSKPAAMKRRPKD